MFSRKFVLTNCLAIATSMLAGIRLDTSKLASLRHLNKGEKNSACRTFSRHYAIYRRYSNLHIFFV